MIIPLLLFVIPILFLVGVVAFEEGWQWYRKKYYLPLYEEWKKLKDELKEVK